jgi:U6 snRNA-associated Sm-like protein LSm2
VELKNDLAIEVRLGVTLRPAQRQWDQGVLKSVDQFLNIKLDSIRVIDPQRHPHMAAVKNCFIRGYVPLSPVSSCQPTRHRSVVRYVQIPKEAVDTQLLEDATRRGERS